MKLFSIIIALIILFFTSTATYSADNSINAVQILWMNCRNFDEVEERILKLKKAGVNTIIIRVFQNKNDRFYPSANFPSPPFTTSPPPPSEGGDRGEVKGGRGGLMKKELGFSDKKIYELLNEMTESILSTVGKPDKILMKVQVIDWDTKASIPEDEIETAINSIKNGRDINLSFVPVTEDTPLNIIEKAFNNSPL